MTQKHELTGINKLRRAVRAFSYVREDFLEQFTAEDLLKIHAAWRDSVYDIPPDEWSERQVREAITLGKPPSWDCGFNDGYYVRCIDSDRDAEVGEGRVVRVLDHEDVIVVWASGDKGTVKARDLQRSS